MIENESRKKKLANRPAATSGYAQGHKWFPQIQEITGDFQPGEREREGGGEMRTTKSIIENQSEKEHWKDSM